MRLRLKTSQTTLNVVPRAGISTHRLTPLFYRFMNFFYFKQSFQWHIKRRAAPQQTKASKTERARLTNHPAVRIYWRDPPKPDLVLINMISSSLWQVAYCCLSHTNTKIKFHPAPDRLLGALMYLDSQAERLSERWMLVQNQNFSRNLSSWAQRISGQQ